MFRYAAFQVLTWGTVLGAVVCAVLLAMIDKPTTQPVVETYTLSSLWPLSPSLIPSPGPAASAAGRVQR